MLFELIPDGKLLFRDGKPFSMGADIWAESVFPPAPQVIYNALRTGFIAYKNGDLDGFINKKYDDLIGNTESYENARFNINGFFIKKGNNYFF